MFPRLTERFTPETALLAGCEACGHTWKYADPDDFMAMTEYGGTCPKCRQREATPAYEEGDRCPGCGELKIELPLQGKWCSRRCQLQAEYAESLKTRTGAR